jgi:cbb3-type cytochrome oxidase maturation protein
MSGLIVLVVSAVGLGALALAGFFWALRAGQFSDMRGASERILIDEESDRV